MESSNSARVLVVAHKTAANRALLDAVHARAEQGPASFTLLVPNTQTGLHRLIDPEDQSIDGAQAVIDSALPMLQEAAGEAAVDGMIGVSEPLAAIQDAINIHGYDEIIISTLPVKLSKWLRLDLPSKAAGLGLPVTTVTASERVESPA